MLSRRFLKVVFLSLLSNVLLRADVTGSIFGLVRDSSQAVVAGARITVTNVETNLTKETTSGSDGEYRFLALPAGSYKVQASAAGFQDFEATGIDVHVNDRLKVDVSFEVGTVKQAVVVEESAVHVETESTQLGDVIDSKKMLSLPLNGRSFIDLLGLQAGVAPTTSGSIQQDRPVSGTLSSGNVSVNGQRETANAFLVNGGDVSEGRNLGAGLIPNLDSIAEFRLITNSFDAEYGRFSGSVMNAITKSGTNAVHGTAFWFNRNDALAARNFFDESKAALNRNQFGFAVGGPAVKNRVFWFTDYQGTRQVQGASTGLVSVPSVDERTGDFNAASTCAAPQTGVFCTPNNTPAVVQGDYWASVLSQRLGYTVANGEAYNAVFPNGVIPQRAWAAPAIGTLPYIPAPNQAGDFYSNNSEKGTVEDDKIGERVDVNSQKTGNTNFYFHKDWSDVYAPLAAASVPGFPAETPTTAYLGEISNIKTFGPSLVNELRLSFFRTVTEVTKPAGSFASLTTLGFNSGVNTLGINPSGPAGFPQTVPPLYFNNFSIGVPTLTTGQFNNTYMVSDGLSKVIGRHSLKFGGEFRYLQINERNTCAPNGDFTFNGNETGIDFADYLLGAPASYNQCSQQFLDSRTRYGGAYVQDAFKLKPNLTINLGLRWEVSMPWYDTQGKIETIVPGDQSTQFPTAPLGWVVPGDKGIPSTLAPTRYNNFGPRIGIAYSPDFKEGFMKTLTGGAGKTSIRAAFGIYYTSIEDLNLFYEVGDAPFGQYWVSPVPPMFADPFQTRADGSSQTQRFPFTFPTPGSPANATLDYSIYLPISYSPGYSIHNRLPYAEHYNFSIQRELTQKTVMTLAFVGTQGHRLISQYDANPGDPNLCLQLIAENATPTCGPGQEGQTFTLPNGSQVFGTRPALGPAFGTGNSYTANISNSNYNALQISVERRASDITFLAAYTYSKAIDNASGFGDWVNFTNYRLSRALSSYDLTNNFVISYSWALPFGRIFSHAPRRLVEGWNLVGITRAASGFPVGLSEGGIDVSLFSSPNIDVPNVVGKVQTQDPHNPGPNGPNTYFLPDAFAVQALGTEGDANRRFFHGPGIFNTDLSLMKSTKVTESTAIEFRAEFYNIFNHTNFNNPNGNISSDTFGVVTSARDPRIGQLSLKFVF
jgi:Carboxypeptidase regulatory-like domain